jgi:flavodoxin
MKVLVIYDSVFGNTEKIARAIGDGIGSNGDVEVLPIGRVTVEKLNGSGILIVGSPTRGFRPTEAISKLLSSLPKKHLDGVQVAAFDTRILLDTIGSPVFRFVVDKGGYAAVKIAKSLEKKGGCLLMPPEGFIVIDTEGPLREGELERAADWAKRLGQRLG